jgi:hypothetical protein
VRSLGKRKWWGLQIYWAIYDSLMYQ